MATSTRKSSSAKPAAAPDTKALEAKIADLESKLASALSQISALDSRLCACEKCCEAAPVASGGRDEDLRTQLREYFRTATNVKVATKLPQL